MPLHTFLAIFLLTTKQKLPVQKTRPKYIKIGDFCGVVYLKNTKCIKYVTDMLHSTHYDCIIISQNKTKCYSKILIIIEANEQIYKELSGMNVRNIS